MERATPIATLSFSAKLSFFASRALSGPARRVGTERLDAERSPINSAAEVLLWRLRTNLSDVPPRGSSATRRDPQVAPSRPSARLSSLVSRRMRSTGISVVSCGSMAHIS